MPTQAIWITPDTYRTNLAHKYMVDTLLAEISKPITNVSDVIVKHDRYMVIEFDLNADGHKYMDPTHQHSSRSAYTYDRNNTAFLQDA